MTNTELMDSLNIQRNGLDNTNRVLELNLKEMDTHKDLLTKDEKIKVLDLWRCVAQSIINIELINEETSGNYLLNTQQKIEQFHLNLLSFSTAYRFALQFIALIEKDKRCVKILEQKNSSLGLQKSAYKLFKFHFLNIKMASRFSALLLVYKTNSELMADPQQSQFLEDKNIIYQYAKSEGVKLTLKNALNILKTGSFKAWFPIQKGVANTIGNIKVWRKGQSLITTEQVEQLLTTIEPGDILLQRREWQATNVGIPGFWSHAAFYLGNNQVRVAFFEDVEVKEWVKGKGMESGEFSELLQTTYPEKYAMMQQKQNEKDRNVIESIAPGVVFTSLHQSLLCDSVVVLRPRLSKLEKAKAIFNAFYYAGLPYDYNFNFLKDDALVCSELIYKSYQKTDKQKGIEFPINKIAGKVMMPANDIAKMFSEQVETDKQQLEMVCFLDGNEAEKIAVESTQDEFVKSYKRPKWHVFLNEKI
ncbi:YiiX/YebB-like N1pC/P60 family cysteine hydrolase [Marinicellulosiphila megalodicopiae]|uniref:YiiX/YebB-like N1pC/P60 family cysteine hydrolase n=1 Tax=Marinicellulosiphila megalodicopiae TaxID=2724896 RepID=UPI003BAFCE56